LYKAENAHIDVTDGTIGSSGNISYGLDMAVSAAAKNKLLWVAQPAASVTEGAVWNAFTIEIADTYVNRTADTDDITVAPSSATFNGTTTRAATAGLASFNDIVYNAAASITVTGSAAGLTATPASSNITVNPKPSSSPLPPITESNVDNATKETILLNGSKEFQEVLRGYRSGIDYSLRIVLDLDLGMAQGFDKNLLRKEGIFQFQK
jgi:hypothetical protein